MDLVKGLNRRGVYVGLQHITDPQFAALTIPRHRLGAVILIVCQTSSVEEEFMEQVNMFIRSVSNMQTRSSDGLQNSDYATGWTIWGSNSGKDEIFRNPPDQLWSPPSPLKISTGSFPLVKRPGRDVDHPPSI